MEKWHTKAKTLLRAADISHQDVADKLNITQSAVSHKLNGRRGATIEEIQLIAEMLGISIIVLIEDDPKFARNPDEEKLIDHFRRMNEDDRVMALKMMAKISD